MLRFFIFILHYFFSFYSFSKTLWFTYCWGSQPAYTAKLNKMDFKGFAFHLSAFTIFAVSLWDFSWVMSSCFSSGTNNSLSSLMLKLDAYRNTTLCSPFPEAFWHIEYYLVWSRRIATEVYLRIMDIEIF